MVTKKISLILAACITLTNFVPVMADTVDNGINSITNNSTSNPSEVNNINVDMDSIQDIDTSNNNEDINNNKFDIQLEGDVEDAKSYTNNNGQTFINFRITEDIEKLGFGDVIEIKWYDKAGNILKKSTSFYTDFLTPVAADDIVGNNPLGPKVGFGKKIPAGYYAVSYVNKDAVKASIKVVKQKEVENIDKAPILAVDNEHVVVKNTEQFNPLAGVTAMDEEDGDLTSNIVVFENTVDLSKEGRYYVTYEVTDSAGNKDTKTIVVTVIKEVVHDDNIIVEIDVNNLPVNTDRVKDIAITYSVRHSDGSYSERTIRGFRLNSETGLFEIEVPLEDIQPGDVWVAKNIAITDEDDQEFMVVEEKLDHVFVNGNNFEVKDTVKPENPDENGDDNSGNEGGNEDGNEDANDEGIKPSNPSSDSKTENSLPYTGGVDSSMVVGFAAILTTAGAMLLKRKK